MTTRVRYRLPYGDSYTMLVQREGSPEVLASPAALNGRQGFVFAPFAPSPECPLLLMQPDEIAVRRVEEVPLPASSSPLQTGDIAGRKVYAADFRRFFSQLRSGAFDKIVLARCVCQPVVQPRSAEQLFLMACRLYPRVFVALIEMPQSGTWLMGTPEVLLNGEGGLWSTMALAGTQPVGHEDEDMERVAWSQKNQEEQQYVASYIADVLHGHADQVRMSEPYTVRAARLYHLRTDFHFRLHDEERVGDLLNDLHPTPAVCGIPKEEARRFILENEHAGRRYYSGFCGPLRLGGATHLFVSLRCMQILAAEYRLYAGGGLLRESREEQEWKETEGKLQAMKRLITP
ncbi:isochorismate synthase [Prevotella sp. KH2C16]|uniref:isochorismate synthase n=1 Tax=Prevotella sp. KH2C16 TaxID=1855325 RepID=UPI0008E37DC9|nr:isochorismate synthase [Prevotella sp. KH2C16]SFG25066.1 isochorismate synthase [Prevotella sp. KH2C16]